MDIEHVFKHHPPNSEQVVKYSVIRSKAKDLAELILELVPDCADRTAALHKLRECVMVANAAIALDGRL